MPVRVFFLVHGSFPGHSQSRCRPRKTRKYQQVVTGEITLVLSSSCGPRMTPSKSVLTVMLDAMSITDSSVKEMSAKSPISMLDVLSHAF
jgi:hypothetical protein